MFDRNRIKQDFSRAAAQYDAHARLQQRVLGDLLAKVRPHLNRAAHILDAGCGTGQLAKILGRNDIIQLDVSYQMCVQSLGNGKDAINGNIESLPFADAGFDAVFSSLVLQWLPDWQAGMREIKRVLKPGGVLAVSTLGENTLCELRESFSAFDTYPHVSPFIAAGQGWQKEVITEYFPDIYSLMRSLKAIGAGNKLLSRRKTMMTRSTLQNIEAFYCNQFGDNKGLPVTWEILYWVQS